ncbi:MAG: peptidase M3, partial [Solirubrobacterales bacterium]
TRPTKSPRAFCSPPRVPEEVYLVMPPVGGREDYAALLHEAGHAEHYGCTDAGLAFEFRHLGDNAVTESFAFLLEGLTASREWLQEILALEGADAAIEHARAARLVMLRRYSAKIAYEVELHGPDADLAAMPGRYSELIGERIGVPWPPETWLSDVDSSFYVACYLRAWALEVDWRRELAARFGDGWFANPDAGEWLRGIWAQGQRLDAERLLAEATGGAPDFSRLASELIAL